MKIGTYLDMTGLGEFKLLGELPEEAIDIHVHLGSYFKLPLLGGINLTGPTGFLSNLKYHVNQVKKYRFSKQNARFQLKGMDGLLDVGLLKTDMNGSKSDMMYLLTSISSLIDVDYPSYLTEKPIALRSDIFLSIIKLLPKFSAILDQANLSNLKEYLAAYTIQRAIVLPIETGVYTRFCDATLDVCQNASEVIPCCSVHPCQPDIEERLRIYKSKGIRMVKFHPDFQGILPDSKEALYLFDLCRSYNMTVQCHVGWPGKNLHLSDPKYYAASIRAMPNLTFILAHIGLSATDATIQLAKDNPNVYLETSGQPVSGIVKAKMAIGAHRILFGSDWPLYHPAIPISRVLEAFPDTTDRCRVFRDNIRELIPV
ncbi:MAG: amidohydrolase family protein [Desulfobacterales bacterium]|nr:amidohydrolase family protein [Desulfobacterales bacterium]